MVSPGNSPHFTEVPGHLLRLPSSRPHSSSGASPPSGPARRTSAECCSKPRDVAKKRSGKRRDGDANTYFYTLSMRIHISIHCVFVNIYYIYICVCMFISGVCYVFGDVLRVSCGLVGFLSIRMPLLLGTKSVNRNITSVASGCKGRE
jgi:hypothetical protein